MSGWYYWLAALTIVHATSTFGRDDNAQECMSVERRLVEMGFLDMLDCYYVADGVDVKKPARGTRKPHY